MTQIYSVADICTRILQLCGAKDIKLLYTKSVIGFQHNNNNNYDDYYDNSVLGSFCKSREEQHLKELTHPLKARVTVTARAVLWNAVVSLHWHAGR